MAARVAGGEARSGAGLGKMTRRLGGAVRPVRVAGSESLVLEYHDEVFKGIFGDLLARPALSRSPDGSMRVTYTARDETGSDRLAASQSCPSLQTLSFADRELLRECMERLEELRRSTSDVSVRGILEGFSLPDPERFPGAYRLCARPRADGTRLVIADWGLEADPGAGSAAPPPARTSAQAAGRGSAGWLVAAGAAAASVVLLALAAMMLWLALRDGARVEEPTVSRVGEQTIEAPGRAQPARPRASGDAQTGDLAAAKPQGGAPAASPPQVPRGDPVTGKPQGGAPAESPPRLPRGDPAAAPGGARDDSAIAGRGAGAGPAAPPGAAGHGRARQWPPQDGGTGDVRPGVAGTQRLAPEGRPGPARPADPASPPLETLRQGPAPPGMAAPAGESGITIPGLPDNASTLAQEGRAPETGVHGSPAGDDAVAVEAPPVARVIEQGPALTLRSEPRGLVAPFEYLFLPVDSEDLLFGDQVGDQPPPLLSEITEPRDVVFRVVVEDSRGVRIVLSERFVVTYGPVEEPGSRP